MPKTKTHSGAKKRLKLLPGGKVKRKKMNRRHCLAAKNHKRKRHLAKSTYVDDANMAQTRRMLLF
jgi:large subunit ribosomal protein L35